MERDVGIEVLVELLEISTLTLATTGHDGMPHAAPVYFAADSTFGRSGSLPASTLAFERGALKLYFFSDPQSQHGQDLASNPHAAAALYPQCFDWQDIRGLQLRGKAVKVAGGEQWEQGWARYLAKFPFVSTLKEIVARNTFYVFVPSWLRLVDNRQGFGFQQEWELS